MAINGRNAKINDTPVVIEDYVAGHLLWEAMRDFRAAYTALTNLCHRLGSDAGGPGHGADQCPTMGHFTTDAQKVVTDMQQALKRADMFSRGDVYDTLIDRTLLGPKVEPATQGSNELRRVYVDDTPNDKTTTFVYGENSGMHVYMGVMLNDLPERGPTPQPFVTVSTEGMSEQYVAGDGEPIMQVSLNDASLYDKEGE